MANTMSGGKFFISATPQNEDLTEQQYEAILWVNVPGIGNHGETGNQQNVVGHDTWDLLFQQKAKGIANAGNPEVEIARIPGNAGQASFRAAAAARNPNNYAFKIERNDAPVGGQPTKIYNRGVVTGPRTQHGRNENFDLELYTLGLVQEQITVEASSISLAGVSPTVADGATVNFAPTPTGGTAPYTYEWYGDELTQFGLAFNPATGAITGTAEGPGVVDGLITGTDSAGNRGTLPVHIVIT